MNRLSELSHDDKGCFMVCVCVCVLSVYQGEVTGFMALDKNPTVMGGFVVPVLLKITSGCQPVAARLVRSPQSVPTFEDLSITVYRHG